VLIARKSLSHTVGVLISGPCSDPIDEMPQNAGSNAKRVWKCADILKSLTLVVNNICVVSCACQV